MNDSRKEQERVSPKARVAEDVDREISAHLDMCVEELVRDGWEPENARKEAMRRFGNERKVRRHCRAIENEHLRKVKTKRIVEGTLQDLRYGARAFLKSKGFSLVAIATLAVGIAANATVFSILNGVLLKPLPYDKPEELVWVTEKSQTGTPMSAAWANFRDWRAESRSFRGLTAYTNYPTTVLGGTEPVYARVANVSRDFWTVFPVPPSSGRLTLPEDHVEGVEPVAVVSEMFAQRYLGGRDALGRGIEISGTLVEVVGIVPPAMNFPMGAELWVPAELTSKSVSRSSHNWRVVGRLEAGLTPSSAALELDPMTVRLVASSTREEEQRYLATGTIITPLQDVIVGDTKRPLFLLMGAAAFVLLVACTNLASTLLARGTARTRELAVRSAVGASRGRIIRQLLSESAFLAALGGMAGIGLTLVALIGLRSVAGASIPRMESVALDGTVLLFTSFVTLFTALAFGLLPALRTGEDDQARVLRTDGRGNEGYKGRIWGSLVMVEVALALVLLTGSGLLVRSFNAVLAVDGGFDEGDVIVSGIALSGIKYPSLEDHRMFWDGMLARAEAIPGASHAGLISSAPASGSLPNGLVHLDGGTSRTGDAGYIVASAGAFSALDIPLLRGRLFNASDGPDSRHVVVVNQSFADKYWPGENPIGKQVSGGGMDGYWTADTPVFGTVVGVVGDVRYRSLIRAARPTVYWNYRQRPYRIRRGAYMVVEADAIGVGGLAESFRVTLHEADPDVAPRIQLLKDSIAESLAERRFTLMIMSGFALTGLFLAALGIFGVVSYAVAQRTREIGIRMALGASGGAVRGMVIRGAMAPVVLGLLVGVAGAWSFNRVIAGLLYEVRPTDPLTFVTVSGVLFSTGLAASWLPTMRGTRVDPMNSLRED
jgi:predicted permease